MGVNESARILQRTTVSLPNIRESKRWKSHNSGVTVAIHTLFARAVLGQKIPKAEIRALVRLCRPVDIPAVATQVHTRAFPSNYILKSLCALRVMSDNANRRHDKG